MRNKKDPMGAGSKTNLEKFFLRLPIQVFLLKGNLKKKLELKYLGDSINV